MAHRLLHSYGVLSNSAALGIQAGHTIPSFNENITKTLASLKETKDARLSFSYGSSHLPAPSHAQPPHKTLCQQASKLDLIDGTTLTSLPLPPPLPAQRLKRGDLESSCLSRGSDSLVNSYKQHSLLSSNQANSIPSYHSSADIPNASFNLDLVDDTFEESEDPIVLVEDYMERGYSEKQMERKKSLMSFKKRVYSSNSASLSSSVNSRKRPADDDECSVFKHPNRSEDLEAIFGKIPGTDRLKHCELCDRPLYEISSIIDLARIVPDDEGNSVSHKLPMEKLYNEFICWDCINLYEHFLEELYVSETSQTDAHKSSTEKLVGIFSSIKNNYAVAEPPKKQTQRPFSNNLLGRLHSLNSGVHLAPKELDVFKHLRDKLRWRWRLNGLIPSVFSQ